MGKDAALVPGSDVRLHGRGVKVQINLSSLPYFVDRATIDVATVFSSVRARPPQDARHRLTVPQSISVGGAMSR